MLRILRGVQGWCDNPLVSSGRVTRVARPWRSNVTVTAACAEDASVNHRREQREHQIKVSKFVKNTLGILSK